MSAARAKALFLDALEREPSERAAFLEAACAGDRELREAVEALLAAHESGSSMLAGEGPLTPPGARPAQSSHELAPGDRVGDYVLESLLGEGGFGRVFAARQEQPIRRRVALKAIRPGLDSRAVLARFQAERQALARMNHPNIARVLDAGELVDGRPYFVMELVEGEPITAFCDSRALALEERLELFARTCQALQHAHTKGVLHRDVKAGNVLVVEEDGRPAPRVIDFGIAKALGDLELSATLTDAGQMIGTPSAMSPEQALGAPDVDTRTDVWALGVLLFELLTGSVPFRAEGRGPGALLELQRRILESESPRPSAEARRGVRAPGVPATLPPELDWIVLRCLEKDRERRYAAASDLALDVRRVLAHEPVEAAPPSGLYRLRKLVRRHRGVSAALAALALALVLGILGTGGGLLRARDLNVALEDALASAREESRLALAVNEFLVADLLRAVRPSVRPGEGKDVTLQEVLTAASARLDAAVAPGGRFAEAPRIEMRIRLALGEALSGLGREDEALPQLERGFSLAREEGVGEPGDRARTLLALAVSANGIGRYAEAETRLAQELPALEAALPPATAELHGLRVQLGTALWRQGRVREAVEFLTTAREAARRELGPDHGHTLALTSGLAIAEDMSGRPAEAEPLFRAVVERQLALWGPDATEGFGARNNLVAFLTSRGKLDEAEAELGALLESQQRVLGADHPRTLFALHGLGMLLFERGDLESAEAVLLEAVERREAARGPAHDDTLTSLQLLARLREAQGRLEEAEQILLDVQARLEDAGRADAPEAVSFGETLAVFYYRHQRLEEALPLARRSWERSEADLGPRNRKTILRLQRLGSIEHERGALRAARERLADALERARDALAPEDTLTRELDEELGEVERKLTSEG